VRLGAIGGSKAHTPQFGNKWQVPSLRGAGKARQPEPAGQDFLDHLRNAEGQGSSYVFN
jgi:hypothetical protein